MKIFYECLYSFIGSFGFAFIFNISLDKVLYAGLGGALSQFCFSILQFAFHEELIRYLFATILVALYSEIFARLKKAPAILFLVPGIIPLVPGGMMYYSMELCISGQTEAFIDMLLNTFAIAGALAMGILLVSSFNKLIRVASYKKQLRKVANK